MIEETVRFILDDKNLTLKLKNLRHSILNQLNLLPQKNELIFSRFSEKDVGARLKDEPRKSVEDLLNANFRRVQEAERALEEYGKLISSFWGERFRDLRFQTYLLEKEVRSKWKKKIDYSLYLITPSSLPEEELLRKVQQAVEAGASVVQLREKDIPDREFLSRALVIKKILPPHVGLIINDRVDIALACEAQGVHLGQDDLSVNFARKLMGEGKIIGKSTHSLQQAEKAQEEGADYIGIGPIFPTSTKKLVYSPLGPEIISMVKKKLEIPVVAIGGISEANIHQVLAAGADGIAVISAVFSRDDVYQAVKSLREKMDSFKKDVGSPYPK